MKKYLLFVAIFSLVLAWCNKNTIRDVDVSTVTDIATLQNVVTQLAEGMKKWTLDIEKAKMWVEQLQRKYLELTGTMYSSLEDQFVSIQKMFDAKAIVLYTFPLWAKRLWMSYPTWMYLDTTLSQQSLLGTTWYYSTLLVYTWTYAIAMGQAKLIADKAHLFVSRNFWKAQALANIGNTRYISGLDISGLIKWIIYVNHDLLDTRMDNFLSVSVDQEGALTIEATRYKK